MLRALASFGPTIEAAGGLDTIERAVLAEMVAFEIMRDQERERERLETAAVGIGSIKV